MPCYTQNLPISLQNQSWYTRPMNFSLGLQISLKIPKSNRSENPFFFLLLFFLLHVYEMLTRSTSWLCLFIMRFYIVQQFIIFTENVLNVEKASLFLSETSLHKLFNINVVILYKTYNIPRISKQQATSQQLENHAMACACKVKTFAMAVRAGEVRPDVMVPHSSLSICRLDLVRTCVPN